MPLFKNFQPKNPAGNGLKSKENQLAILRH